MGGKRKGKTEAINYVETTQSLNKDFDEVINMVINVYSYNQQFLKEGTTKSEKPEDIGISITPNVLGFIEKLNHLSFMLEDKIKQNEYSADDIALLTLCLQCAETLFNEINIVQRDPIEEYFNKKEEIDDKILTSLLGSKRGGKQSRLEELIAALKALLNKYKAGPETRSASTSATSRASTPKRPRSFR